VSGLARTRPQRHTERLAGWGVLRCRIYRHGLSSCLQAYPIYMGQYLTGENFLNRYYETQ